MRLVLLLALCVLASPLASAQNDLATADPFDQLAYNSGHSAAQQFLSQYGTAFSYDLFAQGFRAGMAGDSAQISFALGLRAGFELRADTLSNIDADPFLMGMREGLAGTPLRLSDAQLEAAFEVVQDSLGKRQQRAQEAQQIRQLRAQAATDPAAAARLASISDNKAASEAFLAEVRQRDGIQATESGVLYTITEQGQGAKPTRQSDVTIEYVGRFMDGEVFDQSPPDAPVTFSVRIFVEGFRESVLDMRPGESRTIYIPPHLAYGVLGSPGPSGGEGVPPNAVLVFDLKLVEVAAPSQRVPSPPPPPRN